jgi:hypothetical protein
VLSAVWHTDYLHSGPRFAREIANGWSVSPIVTLRSGTPFSISSGVDSNLDGSSTDRANLVGNPFLSAGRPRSQVVAQWVQHRRIRGPTPGHRRYLRTKHPGLTRYQERGPVHFP